MELNRRNTFRNSIIRINDFSEDAALFAAASIVALKSRLEDLKVAFEKFTGEHLKIVEAAADQAAVDVHNAFFEGVEFTFNECKIKFEERIDDLENQRPNNAPPAAANDAAANNNNQAQRAELPLERIKLPIFNGDYTKWKEWFSTYNSLVHNKGVSNSDKFHCMKNALDGAAANVISGWIFSGENYQAAYDSLVEVYENQYRITMALLDQLFKFEPLKTESHDNLRKLIDTVNRSIRQLTVAGSPVNQWDHVLVHFVLTRMPRATLSIWETTNDLKAMPELNVLLTFLSRQARGNINPVKPERIL